jgi:GNAT superfamily N-acetyltransferase
MEIMDLKEQPEHASALAHWHYREWFQLYPQETIEDFFTDISSCLRDGIVPSTFIAKNDDLLGSVSIIEHDMDTRPELTPWLANVFVTPENRGKGIATRLIKHAMLAAGKAGLERLYLFTPDNEAFYRKLGWSTLCKERYQGHDVAIMQVRLEN